MKKPKNFKYRKFLNRKGDYGLASVLAEVELDKHGEITVNFELHDCRKGVSLDFDWIGTNYPVGKHKKKAMKRNLHKMRILADAVNGMLEATEAMYAYEEEKERRAGDTD